jgi:alanyl-tRNA synthetase
VFVTEGELQERDQATVGLVLDKTCAYAEQGGQIGDGGEITTDTGAFFVETTRRAKDCVLHLGSVSRGRIEVGQRATITIDASRRQTMRNHTATHLLNWALREVLEVGGGGKVDQKGSLVDPDKTRFDFSHSKPLTPEEIERIETLCNEQIRADRTVHTQEVPEVEARKINTLRAVFGEKYPERVRVVSAGADIGAMLNDPENPEWMRYPVEFCGGTHVRRTGEIGAFALTTEEAVAKGIRRVVGITGERAREAIAQGKALLERAEAIKTGPADKIPDGLAELQKQAAEVEIPVRDRIALRNALAELQRAIKQQSKQQAAESAGALRTIREELLENAERVNGTAVVVGELPEAPVEQVRETADWLRTQAGSAGVCLAVRHEGKPMLVAAMTEDLVKKGLKAGELIRHVVTAIDGRGGGKPDLAQAGGKNPDGIPDALAGAAQWIRERLQ